MYVIPTSTPGTLASEISMRFGFRGFSHLISTGCTSSTDAIGSAMRTLRYGHAKMIVAGGVDAPIAPLIIRGFQLMRIMSTRWNKSPERVSRPFSRDRDGFVIAEGARFFVSKTRSRRGRGASGFMAKYAVTDRPVRLTIGFGLRKCGEEPAASHRNSRSRRPQSSRSKCNM